MRRHDYIAKRLMIFIATFFMQFCGPECKLTPKHYMCVIPNKTLDINYNEMDMTLENLTDVLVNEKKIENKEQFINTIKDAPPVIEWTSKRLMCGQIETVGCTQGHYIRVMSNKCMGLTVLAHELVHIYTSRFLNKPDGDHKLPIWQAQSSWMQTGYALLCHE